MIKRLLALLILSSGLGNQVAQSAQIVLEEIEILGVTQFDSGQVAGSLEITAGDTLVRARVVQSAKNLQALYSEYGYEEVQIKSELVRRPQGYTLRFSIQEGLPTRVASFRLIPNSLPTPELERIWEDLEKSLSAQINLKPGTVYQRERTQEIERVIESSLGGAEYVGSSLTSVRAIEVEKPQFGQDPPPEAARWVSLEFQLDLGDRVTFGFRNHKVLRDSELRELLKEQKEVGLGDNYIETLKRKFTEEYLSMGYPHIQISHLTFERPLKQERHVTFVFDEGPRVTIDQLTFEGNTEFTETELAERFFDTAPLLIQRKYYVEADLEKASDQLVDWVRSQGYLTAKVITVSKKFIQDGKAVNLQVYLYEGDQTRIRKVDIQGIHHMDYLESKGLVGAREGESLNLFRFTQGMEALKAEYRNRGYLNMRIVNEDLESVVRYYDDNRTADITVQVHEGPLYKVSEIQVLGLGKTRQEIARRELRFAPGDVLREESILRSEVRIRRLGLFGSVDIQYEPDPNKSDHMLVKVLLSEGTPGIVAGGFGARNDLGARVFGEAAYTNLWHRNHTLSLTGDANRRLVNYDPDVGLEYQVRVSYLYPWFWLDEMKFRTSFTQNNRQYRQIAAASSILSLSWERRLFVDFDPLIVSFTYTIERIRNYNSQETDETARAIDNQTQRIGTISPGVRLDYRDNPLAPTSGFYISTDFEWASEYFGTQSRPIPIGFTRTQLRADKWLPIAKGVSLFMSFRTGFARNLIDPKSFSNDETDQRKVGLPITKQYRLGGVSSLRGYRTGEIQPDSAVNQIQGTLSFVNYRLQIDFPVAGDLRIGPFFDAGNIHVDEYRLDSLRYGSGIGLHYLTPVGPINFDWGFKLQPEDNQENYRFYFSIGYL